MTMPSAKPTPVGLSENKKASKPMIEKRRRARINNSLAQLKSMVVGTVANAQTPNGKPPKLEKADILELTVAHLREMQKELRKTPEDDKYIAGFQYCLNEVRQYIENHIESESKAHVLAHLNAFSDRILCSSNHRSPISDAETVSMDDSSCSSNSRSETPSSLFRESSPIEYRICSPCPESQPETSTEVRLQFEISRFSNHHNRMNADSTCSSSWNQVGTSNMGHFVCRKLNPLNLTYGSYSQNITDSDHQRSMPAHSFNQSQPNYSKITNVNKQRTLNMSDNQESSNISDNSQQDISELVWRPW